MSAGIRSGKPANLRRQTSSGGVIYRRHDSSAIEVALVLIKGGRLWSLPKGLVDNGETPEMTALREVREETGLNGRIVGTLGDISYWYYIKSENAKCRKTVSFFLMEFVSGNIAEHDLEVDDVAWFAVDEAFRKITYRGDREILSRAREKMQEMKLIA